MCSSTPKQYTTVASDSEINEGLPGTEIVHKSGNIESAKDQRSHDNTEDSSFEPDDITIQVLNSLSSNSQMGGLSEIAFNEPREPSEKLSESVDDEAGTDETNTETREVITTNEAVIANEVRNTDSSATE